ncbi:Uncharacterized protein ALO74_05078 [Pseudomonas syringae pv. cunninghamiae]|uniref:Uncharacterized protein n=1 Tax=Pseudomonas savastanoi TaxID=29438 RepID=A0A3M5C0Q2_PSESS|nr:Uncharacterized protein ALO74_05078 [Pseudomonas syringae pv. cunninghamiae]RMS31282.1 hypothetical protein ALP70_04996 [Pseudomonas savastanoi]
MPSMFSGNDASRLTVMVLLGMLGAAWKPIHLVWCGTDALFGLSRCAFASLAGWPILSALTIKTGSLHDLRHPDR